MTNLKWWQRAVFYQIYPRSFADGNGDGIGDLPGIIDRLDYLQDLGIDAIWLSPHFPSPQADCGYDVSDYTDVAPEYGTLADFQRFLDGAHQRGLRVILDLVLNHTSDQHPWFLESRSSRDNPKRDWYVWRPPAPPSPHAQGEGRGGGPPNNWQSTFGGSAWEYDETTGQYYYHYFFKQQPDLNWRNPAVRQAMWKAARFWLNLGVDGFRLDAIGTIFEDPAMPDHTCSMTQAELFAARRFAQTEEEKALVDREWKAMFGSQVDQPGMHPLMQELRQVVNEYPDRVLVGEDDKIDYYGDGENELHLVFNFPLMRTDRLTPAWVRANQQERLSALPPGAWPCNTLGNHDSDRVYSHFGDGENNAALARLSLALMLTLRGTPFLYNGEEIGMSDLVLADISQFRDPLGLMLYRMAIDEVDLPPETALYLAAQASRDKCRTPMPWQDAPNGGFSPAGVTPWLPVNPNYAQGVNVAAQSADPDSLLHFYRQLLRLRRATPALIEGDYTPLHTDAADYLAFLRRCESPEQTCLVVLNLSGKAQTLSFDLKVPRAKRLFSSRQRPGDADDLGQLRIAPFEIYIAQALV